MANGYLQVISALIGIPVWLLVIAFVWSAVWKLLALWKSARKGSVVWFVVLAVVNTLGILPILYIFIFSKMNGKKKSAGNRTATRPARKVARKKSAGRRRR
jgi:Family of unknown function (DUF5652)